jgi:hypothetical protein
MRLSEIARLRDGFANPLPLREARAAWREVRVSVGLSPTAPRLLTRPGGNVKLGKGGQFGLCLLPHRLSGTNLCPYSTPGCRSVCLNTAGRGSMMYVQEGRLARSRFLVERPEAFAAVLEREILNLPPDSAVRLNVLSDLLWEQIFPRIFTVRDDIQFYDYTKYPISSRNTPMNYHLTYSASEHWTDAAIADAVAGGDNVTVVLNLRRSEVMPTIWNGLPVVDGDVNDARYDDPRGVVVGLRAKGAAVQSTTPFVRQP